jgi:pimeloyl-ACP methyl ester carboxylesterase
VFAGAVLARGRRTVTSWTRAPGPSAKCLPVDTPVAAAGKRPEAVAGGPARGYLTPTAGRRVKPRAPVACWGYGDVDGDRYTRPSDCYRRQPPVGREEADRAAGSLVLAGGEPGFDRQGRGRYYRYLRQPRLWTREVTGLDPAAERGKRAPYRPVRNVPAACAPTLLVHGTEDGDVPYAQSAAMAQALARYGVPYEPVTVPATGHGLAGGEPALVGQVHQRALAFIPTHLKAGGSSATRSCRGCRRGPGVRGRVAWERPGWRRGGDPRPGAVARQGRRPAGAGSRADEPP